MYYQCVLLITLGGEQEKSAKSVERRGERFQGFLQSTTVYTGGGQLLPKGIRKNSGVITNFPITHIFTIRRLSMLLPKENHDGRRKKGYIFDIIMIPALWLDLINARDPNTPKSPIGPTFPEGLFPIDLPACKTVGSETYLLVSIAEAKVAGSFSKAQAVPGGHLPSTPGGPPPPFAFSGSDSLAPRETLDHSGFHSFHRETIPAQVEEAGEGKGKDQWEEKKIVALILITFKAMPTPPHPRKKKLKRKVPDSGFSSH